MHVVPKVHDTIRILVSPLATSSRGHNIEVTNINPI